jgi:hypothetical protein
VNATPEVAGGRFGLASPRSAAVLGVLALLLALAGVPLSALAHQLTFTGEGIFVAIVPFALVGFVLARTGAAQSDRLDPARDRVDGNVQHRCRVFYALRTYGLHHHGLPLARVRCSLQRAGSCSSC